MSSIGRLPCETDSAVSLAKMMWTDRMLVLIWVAGYAAVLVVFGLVRALEKVHTP